MNIFYESELLCWTSIQYTYKTKYKKRIHAVSAQVFSAPFLFAVFVLLLFYHVSTRKSILIEIFVYCNYKDFDVINIIITNKRNGSLWRVKRVNLWQIRFTNGNAIVDSQLYLEHFDRKNGNRVVILTVWYNWTNNKSIQSTHLIGLS